MTGNVGETEVTAKFERLGWGVAPNPQGHDLGTDLWLAARDHRLFDLGLLVGAQVKGGASYFGSEQRNAAGEVEGWWYAETDRNHFDAWLRHGTPHIVVLHNLDTGASYWVHVVADAVVSTGQGAKILVPAANLVDEAHLDDLLRVAASKRPVGAWEGSAWTGATAVPPSALLRYALIVPRLIAPHPNVGNGTPVTAAQAVALLVRARLQDLSEQHEQHPQAVPTIQEALTRGDWDWRFFGALGLRVTTDDMTLLLAVVDDAPDSARRTAASVAAAATLIEYAEPEKALAILDAALARDDADPVDYTWLTVQRARALAEIGRREEARDLAAGVQTTSSVFGEDATATALAGVAAALLFNSTAWGQQDIAAVMTRADTTAAWWRAQTTSHALTALTRRTFWGWSRDTTLRFTASDEANDQLFSASLTASFVGDQGAWRHLCRLLGTDGLLRTDRHSDADKVSAALEILRLSGSTEEIKQAVRHLVQDGPIEAVTSAAARVDLYKSTRTTAPADLTLLESGGDALDALTAARTVDWLLRTLDNPSAFIARTSPTFVVLYRLIEVLARVVRAAAPDTQRQIATRLGALPPQQDQATATAWRRVLAYLPQEAWTAEAGSQAATTAGEHHDALRVPLLSIAAASTPEARLRLLDEARTGSLSALGVLGDVTRLPPDVVRALMDSLGSKIEKQIEEAHTGTFSLLEHDLGDCLALLNLWHPASAVWDLLAQLIADPLVSGGHKRGALKRLTNVPERVPPTAREALLTAARAAATTPPSPHGGFFGLDADARGPASELVAALEPEASEPASESLLALIAGDAASRASAARIAGRLGRDEHVGLLLMLAQDNKPQVRAAAAFNLARMVANGDDGPGVFAGVRRAAADPGREVPLAVAYALSAVPVLAPAAEEILDRLRSHASAAVRLAAAEPPDLS